MRLVAAAALATALSAGVIFVVTDPARALSKGLWNEGPAQAQRSTLASRIIEVRLRRGRAVDAFATGSLPDGVVGSQTNHLERGLAPSPFYSPAYPSSGPYSPADPASVYCARRYRSYDQISATYRGLDGLRHHCP